MDTGVCVARHRLPDAEPDSLRPDARAAWAASGRAAEFGHSLQARIGGQLAAGFRLAGLDEDDWDDAVTPLNRLMPVALATMALRVPEVRGASIRG